MGEFSFKSKYMSKSLERNTNQVFEFMIKDPVSKQSLINIWVQFYMAPKHQQK